MYKIEITILNYFHPIQRGSKSYAFQFITNKIHGTR